MHLAFGGLKLRSVYLFMVKILRIVHFFLQLKIQPLLWPVQGTISFTSCFHISSATFPITHSLCSGLSTTTNHQSNSGWVSICFLISYSCLCVFHQLCAKIQVRKMEIGSQWGLPWTTESGLADYLIVKTYFSFTFGVQVLASASEIRIRH